MTVLSSEKDSQASKELDSIEKIFKDHDPLLRAFALKKLSERSLHSPEDFRIFEKALSDTSPEVRKALIPAVMKNYALNPDKSQLILAELSRDREPGVQLAFVNTIHLLLEHSPRVIFEYLNQFLKNMDRYGRYAVLRQLHYLISRSNVHSNTPYKEKILRMLLKAAQDSESEWIQQEAGRTLAHFMDQHPGDLLANLFRCITEGVKIDILWHILHHAKAPIVQHVFRAFIPLVDYRDDNNASKRTIIGHLKGSNVPEDKIIDPLNDSNTPEDKKAGPLNDSNALERIEDVVRALDEVKSLKNGKEIWLLYEEFRRLFRICTLSAIADYRFQLEGSAFAEEGLHASVILRIYQRLDTITRPLRIYQRREGLNDRLSSLLEASRNVESSATFAEREYANTFSGNVARHLPDYQLFALLFQRWNDIISTQLQELRGRAELRADLKTKSVPYEEQIGIWLMICNDGRSAANNVKISLLHNEEFDIVGTNSFETEVIFAQEEVHAEFSIRPHMRTEILRLIFEIVYDDAEAIMKTLMTGEQLQLQAKSSEFHTYPQCVFDWCSHA